MPRGKKKGAFQPTKYDWVGLEAQFLASPLFSVAAFMKGKGIPSRTWTKATTGWGEKKKHIRDQGLQILINEQVQKVVDTAKSHFSLGAGVIKIGLDGLLPQQGGKKALKPASAAEAAKMIKLGTDIQRHALGNVDVFKAAAVTPPESGNDANKGPILPVVQVRIGLPSNGRELKE